MILADTSAFVEFLRATGSPVHRELRRLIEGGAPVATSDPVVMELLAGARDETHAARLRSFLLRFDYVPVLGLDDYERAAVIYRRCRANGTTIRSMTDCLVAAVAIRAGIPVLENDRDFKAIAQSTELELHVPA